MITLVCDRCEKPIHVGEDLAGKKIQCPSCGDVNVVPVKVVSSGPAVAEVKAAVAAAPSGSRKDDRAAARGLPPDSGPEQQVAKVHPAMFRARPLLFILLMVLLIGGAIGAVVFLAAQPAHQMYGWACAGAAVLALVVLLAWKIKTLDTTLLITNKRVVATKGLFSRKTSEVGHENVQNIQISQTFWERLWGVGKIGISSSGQSDVEIEVEGVARPYQIRETIDAYRNSLG